MDKRTNLSPEEQSSLLATLQERFNKHKERHPAIEWSSVEARLLAHPDKLVSLSLMENSGGEPDVVVLDDSYVSYTFVDCSLQSPGGRRSLCYDQAAHDSRKTFKPSGNACSTAADMGIKLMTEQQYARLQTLGIFDTTTSSWLQTPDTIRSHGGAIFGDRRYDTVFTYHNGAESYYAARGFRGILLI